MAHPGPVFLHKAVGENRGVLRELPPGVQARPLCAQSHAPGDIHQPLDDLGVGGVEGQPVHLHAHSKLCGAPGCPAFFLPGKKLRTESEVVEGEEKERQTHDYERGRHVWAQSLPLSF